MSVILRTVQLMTGIGLVFCHGYRYPVTDRVTTDDKTTSMDTCATYGSLQHFRIFNGVAQPLISRYLSISQLFHTFNSIGEVHLQIVRQTVGDLFTQMVDHIERHFLHTSHILDRVLSSHCTIGDDMGTVFVAIFIFHPLQYFSTAVIIKIGIYIRQGDAVRIKETLKKKIVFDRIDFGDSQAICHNTASC